MTAIEIKAKDVQGAAFLLGHFLSTTDPNRLRWEPKAEGESSKSRSAMDVVEECVEVNYKTAAALRGQPLPSDEYSFDSVEQAREALAASAGVCAEAIREQDSNVFEKVFAMPWGEVNGDFLIGITIANMHYHIGQINYIQRLYGDEVFHVPARG